MGWIRLLLVILLTACVETAQAGDPTRPHDWSNVVADRAQNAFSEALQLNQIIAFGDRRYAIINGQRYQQDDQINGYTITLIQSQRVRLQNGEKEIELTMFTPSIKLSSTEVGDNQ